MQNKKEKELKLEVGKYYRDRIGEVRKIEDRNEDRPFPFVDEKGRTYKHNGRWSEHRIEHDCDLIEEALPLEIGKFYLTRAGGAVVKIIFKRGLSDPYCFYGDNGLAYTEYGNYYRDRINNEDLVKEIELRPMAAQIESRLNGLHNLASWCMSGQGNILGIDKAATSNPKDLIGVKKPRLSYIPPAALAHQAIAHEDGNKKYGMYNWRENKVEALIYVDAAMRHLISYLDGEDYSQDSKVHHLASVAANMNILLDATESGNLIDNRPIKGKGASVLERLTKC